MKAGKTPTNWGGGVPDSPKRHVLEINTDQLSALLDMLVESGVEEFEGFGFHVRFTEALFTKDKEVPTTEQVLQERERFEPRSSWEDPSLWPGGKPPGFPK